MLIVCCVYFIVWNIIFYCILCCVYFIIWTIVFFKKKLYSVIAWDGDKEFLHTGSIQDQLYKQQFRDEVLACYATMVTSQRYREENDI